MSARQPPPSQEELLEAERAAIEEQLSRMSSAEMALQAAVSLINIGGRRLGLVPGAEGERDLEQVRDAIDAVRGLMPVLERHFGAELRFLRDALSQLQMAYAQEARRAPSPGEGTPAASGAAGQEGPTDEKATQAGDATTDPAPGETTERAPEPGMEKTGGAERAPGPAEASGRLWVPKP